MQDVVLRACTKAEKPNRSCFPTEHSAKTEKDFWPMKKKTIFTKIAQVTWLLEQSSKRARVANIFK